MLFLPSIEEAQSRIAQNCRARRLQMGLTQPQLAERANIPFSTLRRFERKAAISLENFLKLQTVLGGLSDVVAATDLSETAYGSIDEILRRSSAPKRQRGLRS